MNKIEAQDPLPKYTSEFLQRWNTLGEAGKFFLAAELLDVLKAMVSIAKASDWDKSYTGRQIVLEEAEETVIRAEKEQTNDQKEK